MPESSTTITQFEHTHTTFDKVHQNTTIQDSKYKRKGYGFIMSIIITFAFFFITPRILGLIFPSLASGYDPIWFISFSCASLHAISNILCYSVYYLIYRVKSPFFEKYKISNEPWPWESNREEWIKQLKKAAGLYSINNFVIGPVMILSILLLTGCKLRTTIDSLPTTKEIIIQILFCTFVEDLYSYLGHRLMHTKYLYPHFHKIHHQSNKTVSITNEFAHPIEFALVNLLASLIGPKLLGGQMHVITTWMWILVRVAESVDAHGGYDFSWSPFKLMPLGVSPTYHDFHHSENLGNFGSMFTIWDTVFKTNRDYWDSQAKQKKDSQVDIQRRVKTMVQDSLSVKPLIQTMQESEVQNITQSGDKKND